MNRARIRELALIAVAGGMLAFEVIALRGALPTAMVALADGGITHEVGAASRNAVGATASVLNGAGEAATDAAIGAAKATARWLGTVTPSRYAARPVWIANRARHRGDLPHVRVIAVKGDGRCAAETACRSLHRAHEVRAAVAAALRQAVL
jgi:hypothetical protein